MLSMRFIYRSTKIRISMASEKCSKNKLNWIKCKVVAYWSTVNNIILLWTRYVKFDSIKLCSNTARCNKNNTNNNKNKSSNQ